LSRGESDREVDGRDLSSGTLVVDYLCKLGYSSVDSLGMILKMHLMLQRHSTDLAPDLIPFFDVSQMLPLEVLRQVSWTGKLVGVLFERQALLP
jgi:hypothetical protein